MALSDKISARIKVTAYKPEENPDDRISLCGEPFQRDKDGRQFAIIPGHCADYQKQMLPRYEFSEEYEVREGEEAAPKKIGRPKK